MRAINIMSYNYAAKRDNNEIFTTFVLSEDISTDIILLDGVDLNSTKMLLDYRADKSLLHVVEMYQTTYKSQCKKGILPREQIHLYNVENYLRRHAVNVGAVYFDYLGTVDGNKYHDIFPMRALEILLTRTRQKKLVIAFTFCTRSAHGLLSHHFRNMPDQIEAIVRNVITSNKYRIKDCYKKGYTIKQVKMCFLVYVIKFDQNVIPTRAYYYKNSTRKRGSWK